MWWNALGSGNTRVQTQLPHLGALGPACEAGRLASCSCGDDEAGLEAPGPGRGLEPALPTGGPSAAGLYQWVGELRGGGGRAEVGMVGSKTSPPPPPQVLRLLMFLEVSERFTDI